MDKITLFSEVFVSSNEVALEKTQTGDHYWHYSFYKLGIQKVRDVP